MTDFASLLVADRGHKARAIHLVDKAELRRLGQGPPRRGPRPARRAPLRRQERLRLRHPAARRRFRSGRRGRRCRRAVAVVPRQAGRSAARGHVPSGPGEPGKAALGWLLAQHRFDDIRKTKDAARRPARAGHRRGARIDRRSAWPRRPRWSATWSTPPPATSARPSSSKRCATRPARFGGKVRVTSRRRARAKAIR